MIKRILSLFITHLLRMSNKDNDNNKNSNASSVIIPQVDESNAKGNKSITVSLSINVAKKKNKGEDSDPIAGCYNDAYIAATFDGMGGSGATEYATENGTYTGAYLASREVKKICEDYFRKSKSFDLEELSTNIRNGLNNCVANYGIKPSGLRSSIIRTLPTTLAIIRAQREGHSTHVMSYWCGDSRNYILTKSGLRQASLDHLSKQQDPLENLRNDESLSNCICQDKEFSIEAYDCGTYTEPIIILSATDGCFGYIKTPIHFEYMLLKTLRDANGMVEWKQGIIEWLNPISGDDFSVGLVIVDKDFEYWKDALKTRLELLEKEFISKVDNWERNIEEAKQEVKNKENELNDGIENLWKQYKEDYMLIKKD